MFMMYAVIRGQLEIHQLMINCKLDSIVNDSNNHKIGLWLYFVRTIVKFAR